MITETLTGWWCNVTSGVGGSGGGGGISGGTLSISLCVFMCCVCGFTVNGGCVKW